MNDVPKQCGLPIAHVVCWSSWVTLTCGKHDVKWDPWVRHGGAFSFEFIHKIVESPAVVCWAFRTALAAHRGSVRRGCGTVRINTPLRPVASRRGSQFGGKPLEGATARPASIRCSEGRREDTITQNHRARVRQLFKRFYQFRSNHIFFTNMS